jgi:hypothetical protein
MNNKLANNNKSCSNKNLSALMEYAQYVIENSRSVNAEAQKLRDSLKISHSNTKLSADWRVLKPNKSLQHLKNF